jgi:hypothetical protein
MEKEQVTVPLLFWQRDGAALLLCALLRCVAGKRHVCSKVASERDFDIGVNVWFQQNN